VSWQPDGWQPEGGQPEGWQPSSGSVGFDTRIDFYAKRLRRDFYIRSNDVSDDFLFEDVVKDPAAYRKVRLRLYALAVNEWKPNEQVSQNEFVRPRIPNGFAYEATSTGGGLTAAKEPRWPKTVTATVIDGGVTWTCRAASTNGINAVSSPSAASDPTGLTIGSVAVAENCDILATYSGGIDGTTYDVAFTWTLDGLTMVGRQKVIVAKQ
jgi:hypothetical protein